MVRTNFKDIPRTNLSHTCHDLSNSNLDRGLDRCGCCDGIRTFTPAIIENPPSLSSIRYRVGTHGMFKTSMLANLSRKRTEVNSSFFYSLSNLTTREDNDLAIAIIDAWATIADVLTFYQERIANEGFLRTATERMSILELARSIGYELGRGVASDTYLTFELEPNDPNITNCIIDIGTKVQSIPQQGEMPQTYETIEKIEARPHLNKIKANTKLPHIVTNNTSTLYFNGTDTKLRQNDVLLLIDEKYGQISKFVAKVLEIKRVDEKDFTIVKILIVSPPQKSDPTIYNTATKTTDDTTNSTSPGISCLSGSNNINQKKISSDIDVLKSKNDKVRKMADTTVNEMNLSQIAAIALQKGLSEEELIEGINRAEQNNLQSLNPKVYVFRQKAAIFGHNAPIYSASTLGAISTPTDTVPSAVTPLDSILSDWDSDKLHIFEKVIIRKDKEKYDRFEKYSSYEDKPVIFLDRVYENIITNNPNEEGELDNWVIFSSTSDDFGGLVFASQFESTREETLVEYSVSGRATGIQLKRLDKDEQIKLGKFRRRNTTVFVQSERLELAAMPDETPVEGNFIELERNVIGLKKGQTVIISGEIIDENGRPTGRIGTECKKLHQATTTKKIFFDVDLTNKYLRESVIIYSNVAKATHGETKLEVLGSGDPSLMEQSFTLKQKPLTYIKAPTLTGASSTLEIRINDKLWKEVDYLYKVGPKDQVFVTRNQDDGSIIIIFGDGRRGSKPDSGVENIFAKYRIGTGREGLLRKNQLSILMDRPLGVKSVTNNDPTSLAEDPEILESARTNAPLRVLTMNRIVSVSDLENFARSFVGIGKVKASKISNGIQLICHLTVTSSLGERLDPLTTDNLKRAIERFKDPQIPFMLDSFIEKKFSLTAKIKVRKDMLSDKILLSIKNIILETFSFEKRQFGQPVTLSEVVTLIQNIDGVIFIDMEELHIDHTPRELYDEAFGFISSNTPEIRQSKLEKYLACSLAYYDNKEKKIIPAEILIVNPEGVEISVID